MTGAYHSWAVWTGQNPAPICPTDTPILGTPTPTRTPADPTATSTPGPPTATFTPAPPTPTPTEGPVNLVRNPGAETGDFSFWTTGGWPSDGIRIDPDSHVPFPPTHSGDHRFGISVGYSPASLVQYQEIDVIPGHTYRGGFYVYKEDGTQEAARMAWIEGEYGGEEHLLADTGQNRINWWGHLQGSSFTPTTDRITLMILYTHADSSGIAAIHVDDIYLRDETVVSPTPTATPGGSSEAAFFFVR